MSEELGALRETAIDDLTISDYRRNLILWAVHRIETLETMWVPCSQQLPDIGVRVIVLCGTHQFVDIGRFDGVDDCGFDRGPRWRDDLGKLMVRQWHPTHWMSLPKPPDEKIISTAVASDSRESLGVNRADAAKGKA